MIIDSKDAVVTRNLFRYFYETNSAKGPTHFDACLYEFDLETVNHWLENEEQD